jgi:hypothetical protein
MAAARIASVTRRRFPFLFPHDPIGRETGNELSAGWTGEWWTVERTRKQAFRSDGKKCDADAQMISRGLAAWWLL